MYISLDIISSNGQKIYLSPSKYDHYCNFSILIVKHTGEHIHTGLRVNSTHYLAKLELVGDQSHQSYTVIPSFFDLSTAVNFTIKVSVN